MSEMGPDHKGTSETLLEGSGNGPEDGNYRLALLDE
jgi:hypothetical protein